MRRCNATEYKNDPKTWKLLPYLWNGHKFFKLGPLNWATCLLFLFWNCKIQVLPPSHGNPCVEDSEEVLLFRKNFRAANPSWPDPLKASGRIRASKLHQRESNVVGEPSHIGKIVQKILPEASTCQRQCFQTHIFSVFAHLRPFFKGFKNTKCTDIQISTVKWSFRDKRINEDLNSIYKGTILHKIRIFIC